MIPPSSMDIGDYLVLLPVRECGPKHQLSFASNVRGENQRSWTEPFTWALIERCLLLFASPRFEPVGIVYTSTRFFIERVSSE